MNDPGTVYLILVLNTIIFGGYRGKFQAVFSWVYHIGANMARVYFHRVGAPTNISLGVPEALGTRFDNRMIERAYFIAT